MNILSHMKRMTAFIIVLVLGGCVGAPEGVEPVNKESTPRGGGIEFTPKRG